MVINSQEQIVPVILRVDQEEGEDCDVFALFPTLPSDLYGRYCDTYTFVGGHSGADYYGCIQRSRPATAEESATLIAHLERMGYRLQVMKRASCKMHMTRKLEAREFRRECAQNVHGRPHSPVGV